jgi:adenylate cyclase class 2
VPIEAELKARVRDPDHVRDQLAQRGTEEVEVYHDTYLDYPDSRLDSSGQELRVRIIEAEDGARALLTYKAGSVDSESGSKPEYETGVADAEAARTILGHLGYVELISFTKRCRNYRFEAAGWDMLATLVTVPEIDGTFLEVETAAEDDTLGQALDAVRGVLTDLGIADEDLTTELYTDAVKASRDQHG